MPWQALGRLLAASEQHFEEEGNFHPQLVLSFGISGVCSTKLGKRSSPGLRGGKAMAQVHMEWGRRCNRQRG